MEPATVPSPRALTRRPGRRALAALGLALFVALPVPVAAAEEPAGSPETTAPPSAEPTPAPTATPEPTLEPASVDVPAPDPTPDPGAPAPTTPPTATEAPASVATPAPTPVTNKQFMYRSGALARQYTNYWCVPAATQSMLNLIRGTSDRSYATQRKLYYGIRKHNRYWYRSRGNDPQGWAWGLRYYSGNRVNYQARSFTNKSQAMWTIHDSIARTGHPVGITVWNGTHAWIVLGYRSTSDPEEPSKRTLLGFYVSGPLAGGRDPWPYRYLKLEDFRRQFSMYHEWQRSVIWEDKWVVISQ